MEHQKVTPERLPPLELRPMRDLDLEKVSGEPEHLSAASGIVRRGVFAYVIGDDLLDLGIFDLSGAGPGRLRQVLSGEAARRRGRGAPRQARPGVADGAAAVREQLLRRSARARLRLEGKPGEGLLLALRRRRLGARRPARGRLRAALREAPRRARRDQHRGGVGVRRPALALSPRQPGRRAQHRRRAGAGADSSTRLAATWSSTPKSSSRSAPTTSANSRAPRSASRTPRRSSTASSSSPPRRR